MPPHRKRSLNCARIGWRDLYRHVGSRDVTLRRAREHRALNWLALKSHFPKISRKLLTAELLRTCQRIEESLAADVQRLLDGVDFVPIDHVAVEQAAMLYPYELRSLETIHLANALSLREDFTNFVAYDVRLCPAAVNADCR